MTWYNRSVGVQGEVYDYTSSAGSTTAKFVFFQSDVELSSLTQTRTSSGGSVSFNFLVEGPSGGINGVQVWLCHSGDCFIADEVTKPI
ncbi:hypothetical protein MRQ36_22165 [Micromonospora sp. R77]|uniref:hypothetical protein n=1 Tax=Micromonospora sp. R77 TaxID=2925836 RepID=UPI001F617B94|nr:hypothetical protein [Micromonospora sp. R77]MCI4065122.1 hypothetical protein [Micromonospora sp. R77]